MDEFHFLRPWWLLAFIPLVAVLFYQRHRVARGGGWERYCDVELLPHILDRAPSTTESRFLLPVLALAGTLGILALAGPAWERIEQPVFQRSSALVIVLDLSRSMDAADLQPSRLQRARFKVRDLLQQRREGESALVVFAAQPFVVTPLTTDTDTIESQLLALNTDLMPAQGSRLDLALAEAARLLEQARSQKAQVLVLADGLGRHEDEAREQARLLAVAGHRVSIIGVGTEQGAPVPTSNGFFHDSKGDIVMAPLEGEALKTVAASGGGRFNPLTVDDTDLQNLLVEHSHDQAAVRERSKQQAELWQDRGPWLLWPLLALVSLLFRRGLLLTVVLVVMLPMPRPAMAMDWGALWRNQDQNALQKLQQGQAAEAAEAFSDPRWQAAAHYRAGNYEQSQQLYGQQDTADALYNQGNAQAQMGRIEQAIESYRLALEKKPNHEDARYNLEQLEKYQQQQQQSSSNNAQNQDSQQQDSQQQQGSSQQGEQQQQQGSQDQQQGPQQGRQPDSPQGSGQSAGQQGNDAQQQQGEQQQQQNARQDQQADEQDKEGRQAQQAGEGEDNPEQQAQAAQAGNSEQDAEQSQQELVTEQWLRKIPDDPGGLLRRKFRYQYQGRGNATSREEEAW